MAYRNGCKVSIATLRAMWADDDLTVDEIGARLGISGCSVRRLAYQAKFPPKRQGRPPANLPPIFDAMWRDGVDSSQIAAHFGVALSTVWEAAKARNLPARHRGQRAKMTVPQFFEAELARAMAQTAEAERAQLRLAEMVDTPTRMWRAA